MKKILISLLLLSTISFAQIIQFSPNDPVNSQEFNENFNYIKNFLKFKNREINFTQIGNNSLITKELIEDELGKLQTFGITAQQLDSSVFIKSENINSIFQDIIEQTELLEIHHEVIQNNIKNIDLSSINSNYPNSFSIEQQGTKGTAVMNGSILSYTPQTNILGSDFVVVKALNGNIVNKTVKINLNIDGEGLIQNGSFITYHDGSLSTSCNGYKTTNLGKKKYVGATGNGIYKISIPTVGDQLVYCDMTTDSGGWTLIASGGSSCTNFVQKGLTAAVYNTHPSYGTNCGYLAETVVRRIANVSTNLRLRVGSTAASFTQVNSTGDKPLQSLRNATNWHTNNAHLEFSPGFQWAWSCASAANSWPNMFHACNYTNGVHWLGVHKHSHIDSGRPVVSSTWLK